MLNNNFVLLTQVFLSGSYSTVFYSFTKHNSSFSVFSISSFSLCTLGSHINANGQFHYKRNYYTCDDCHCGFYPLDKKLGVQAGQMSEEVMQLAALFEIDDAFGTSRDLLKRSALLELSPNSIRKAMQVLGEAVIVHERKLIEESLWLAP